MVYGKLECACVEFRSCTEDTNHEVIRIRVVLKAMRIKDMRGQWKRSKD